MTLHTVGPASAAEDEQVIGKGYKIGGFSQLLPFLPLVVAYFADAKWVVAVAATMLLAQGHETGGRLHDLCIRLRRTNLLLRDSK